MVMNLVYWMYTLLQTVLPNTLKKLKWTSWIFKACNLKENKQTSLWKAIEKQLYYLSFSKLKYTIFKS